MLLAAFACSSPPVDAGGPILDVHTHCPVDRLDCDLSPLAEAEGVTAAVLGLSHYAIGTELGDPKPPEISDLAGNNDAVAAATMASNQALLVPSLDCLAMVAGSDADFTQRCLEDADRWLAQGAVGFKDHAGKTFDGEIDAARWVGAYNRLAGWCETAPNSPTPNLDCLGQDTMRMPLEVPAWREMIRGLVEERGVPVLSHATPWHGSDTLCGANQERCFDRASDALVDFASWAESELSEDARRRFVVLHLGFFSMDEVRLRAVLDAGFSVDLAQTDLMGAGCGIRALVAEYPDQVVLGTDIFHGLSCTSLHYEAWTYALMGAADQPRTIRNTCRDTVTPIGAELANPDAGTCGIAVEPGVHRKVLFDNAARLFAVQEDGG